MRANRLRNLHVVTALLAVVAVLATLQGCDLLRKRTRRFGASCGLSTECESGLCHDGFCTTACVSGSECGSGVCIEKVCQAADQDFDGDGVGNQLEAKLGLQPDQADSDGDGLEDGQELGPNAAAPADSNGDKKIDAVQSNLADADQDCIVDAFDKQPGQADALSGVEGLCATGVCAAKAVPLKCVPPTAPPAKAEAGVACLGCVCDGQAVAGFEQVESACDQLDNDCDGETDEGASLQGLPLGAACVAGQGVCAASGGAGTVVCGKQGKAVCSADLAQANAPETCNGVDDNCDGATDEGLFFNNIAVGGSCAGCGYKPALCPDGKPLNAAVVRCGPEGTPVCGGVPAANAFSQFAAGAPGAGRFGAFGWREKVARWELYGGLQASVGGAVATAAAWRLTLDSPATAASWQQQADLPAGPRVGSALAVDPDSGEAWLVGGSVDGKLAKSIWYSAQSGTWTQPMSGSPGWVAELPAAEDASSLQPVTRAFVLRKGTSRTLVVIDPRYVNIRHHLLDGGAQAAWSLPDSPPQPVSTSVWCAAQTPSGDRLLVATSDGKWLTVSLSGTAVDVSPVQAENPPPVRVGAQCVIDGASQVHVIGGYEGGQTVAQRWSAKLIASGAAVQLSFASSAPQGDEALALNRAYGWASWSPSRQAVVLGGGERNDGSGSQWRPDVVVWSPANATVSRADRPVPAPRFGHAMAVWPQQGDVMCVAGGLTAEMPAPASQAPRVVAVEDVWCAKAGLWTRKAAKGLRFAFGASAFDATAGRMVLAGGLALQTPALSAVSKLWQGGLYDAAGKVPADMKPTDAVQLVDLGASVEAAAALSTAATPLPLPLAAPSSAWDPLRQRLLLFGGFDSQYETKQFLALDLKTLKWSDLGALLPVEADKTPKAPTRRYGAPAFYDPWRDQFAVTGGAIRTFDSQGLPSGGGYDFTAAPANAPAVGECMLTGYAHLAVTNTLGQSLSFKAYPLPLYKDLQKPKAAEVLLSPYVGGPVFVPVLYDALGGRGWMAMPAPPPPLPKNPAAACTELQTPALQAAALTHQLRIDIGRCGSVDTVVVDAQPVANTPPALLATAGVYDEPTRTGWLAGGLDRDGVPSAAVYRLTQTCLGGP